MENGGTGGGSYLPPLKKILVAVPHHRDLEPETVVSIVTSCQALTNLNVESTISYQEGALIHGTRNEFFKRALNEGVDFILFVDSDMTFDAFDVGRLLDDDKDIVGGIYYMRGTPYSPIVYKRHTIDGKEGMRKLELSEIPNETFEVDGLGCGFVLIRRPVIEALMDKQFVLDNGLPFNHIQLPWGESAGEDLSFYMRAKKAGFSVWCNPTTNVGHIGRILIQHPLSVSASVHHYSNPIDGWCSTIELDFLYRLARECRNVVEIGSWKGRSTSALLTGANGFVFAVDTWLGSKSEPEAHKEAREGDVYSQFIDNTKNFRNVVPLKMESNKAAELFVGEGEEEIDMVFIDGEHTYEAVKEDITKWLPITKKILCGHDYNFEGVKKAVDELIGAKNVTVKGSIWVYRRESA